MSNTDIDVDGLAAAIAEAHERMRVGVVAYNFNDRVLIEVVVERAIEAYLSALQPTDAGVEPVAVYRVDWEQAPRDGTWVLLLDKDHHPGQYRTEHRLFWSKHYSIHGLGGCWSDGFVTMSDLDFVGWRYASPEAGSAPDWNYLAAALEKHMDAFPGPEFIRPFVPALRALASPTVEREADGWIDWAGDKAEPIPLPVVEVRRRDGHEMEPDVMTSFIGWVHQDRGSDIVAYRVLNPTPPKVTP